MSDLSPDSLLQTLQLQPDSHVVLALSGGLDSMVLLDLLAKARLLQPFALQAVYINHGISASAAQWGDFCARQCTERGIAFVQRSVALTGRDNLELKARTARYQALAEFICSDKHLLLTAHHGDDQLESLILALKRGSGPAGLSGIAAQRSFAAGMLSRPLLPFSRAELAVYAGQNQLNWVNDDSNEDTRFERNFIRQHITPVLLQRWPQFIATARRSMQHLADLQQLADYYTEQAQQSCVRNNTLLLTELAKLIPLQQDLVIRRWLQNYALNPQTHWLTTLKQQVIAARGDATPVLVCGNYQLRRFADKLYLLTDAQVAAPVQGLSWQGEAKLQLPCGSSLYFSAQPQPDALPLAAMSAEIVFGQLSLRFKPAGSAVSKPLKQWFKLWQVPPWLRLQVPLLLVNGELVAVAGFASSTDPQQAKCWLSWQKQD
ncbi:tRNA(Ile)-lysidine synthase [Rheinheimera pacifica]|uniref:tRNA(Ile)-lysidine synthase n=1 Tax=Rheinheimera pacifica TaxID=173990 RepID=A0A1H6M0K5_9GAMM|nr:tRNA lysidine(34) synthetase TilS [Rheinheimera pacifica]SEH91435.1 tRNA(Ile)-lysidine synthase [Rheinheimera pacifica]